MLILEMPVFWRAKPSIICNDAGRQIECNVEQSKSEFGSIPVSFDPDSNVIEQIEEQDSKERAPRNSTEAGRQIDFSDEQEERASASIRVSFEPDSNANEQSE
jgi:hypothetical protein